MFLNESEFYDYKTAPVVGNDVVDLHRTGMSYYDDFLTGSPETKEYLKKEKNVIGEVLMMSPDEYFKACSEYGFPNSHPSVESLKAGRRRDIQTLTHLKDVLTKYKRRFPMPVLNKADSGQEGLHRMMVIGDLLGWDHKVPVLVIDWADKQRAFEKQKRERIERIEYNIKKAVQNALMYKFTNIDELREQIQWELDKQFDYNDDDIKIPVEFELTSDEKEHVFIVSIGAASYDFDYDAVNFIDSESDEEDDFDIDDDDIEDFLKRHFGDDWRKTDSHLKYKFNIKENLSEDLNSIVRDVSSYVDKYDSNGSNQNCLFSTWAVELQLRGEDFFPRPVYSPRDPIFDIKGEDIIINPKRIKIKSKEDVRTQVLDAGEGARFYCHVNWEGSNGGHEFMVINDNNTVLIVDGQSGYINEIDKDKEYFEDINFKNSYIVRLDNKEINQDILKYNDEDQIIEWDDELDPKLLEEKLDSDINKIDNIIVEYWGQDTPGDGCIFIHPCGKFINIYPKLDDHEDLCYWLEELEDYDFDTPEDAEWFVSEFDYVRCRSCKRMSFIEVPKRMTAAQYVSLEEWLNEKVMFNKDIFNKPKKFDIEAWSGEWKTYIVDDYLPEDIVKIIKRSYTSGKLYEKLK